MYSVYRHTAPNGKVYIGITKLKPEQRWRHGDGYSSNIVFSRAIEKYGWDSFKHEVLLDGLTKNEAKEAEKRLIAEHRATERSHGYNITPGGDVPWHAGKHLSAEHAAKITAHMHGETNPKARSVICLETLEVYKTMTRAAEATGATKISECCIRMYKHRTSGGYHWAYYDESKPMEYYSDLLARYITEESAPCRISEAARRKTIERCSVPILCVETGKVYSSIAAAADAVGADKPNICNCCKGKRKTAAGYHWRYVKEAS